MPPYIVDCLLELVTPIIIKEDTRLRTAISPAEQLTITLRSLATVLHAGGKNHNRMVYKYVRKSTNQSWKEDDMLHAIKGVTSGAICVVRKTIWGSKKYAAPEVKGQEQTGA
ncbi:hypothetical protein LSAT2_014765 [Lamellibrachia satsuma]|nr:hypothetical protein LSAT2_014765 [Lamellibrachia satsuma]